MEMHLRFSSPQCVSVGAQISVKSTERVNVRAALGARLAAFPALRNATWVVVPDIAAQLRNERDRRFEELCSYIQSGRHVDELHFARCLSGLERPGNRVGVLIARGCKERIQLLFACQRETLEAGTTTTLE